MKMLYAFLLILLGWIQSAQVQDWDVHGTLISPSVLKWLDKAHLQHLCNVTIPEKQRVWLTANILCVVQNFEPLKCLQIH